MGQKTSPTGFRLAVRKQWLSSWYANKNEFGDLIAQDLQIRNFLQKKKSLTGTSKIKIKRMSGKIEVTICTARPGLVIGKKGTEIDLLKGELNKLIDADVWIEVEEIKRPDLDAKLVAEGVARQLVRRMPFRRVLKKSIQTTMDAGAEGIKIQVSGRIGGAEIARTEWYKEGSITLHTLRANIDYDVARAETTYGSIGVKVWIKKPE